MLGLIMLISLIISLIKCEQVCDKFLIHHDMSNCVLLEVPNVRRALHDFVCLNQGTWNCSFFECVDATTIDGETICESGIVNHLLCCKQHNIRYIDFWIRPLAEWYIEFFNLIIAAYDNTSSLWVNDEEYVGVYDFQNKETFVSIVLSYCENCQVNVSVYINGTLRVINYYENPLEVYDPNTGVVRLIFDVLNGQSYNVLLYFMSANTIVPTDEEIMWLYTLGKNRSVDTEICYDLPCTNGNGISSGYKTATIILGIVLGITFLLLLLLLIWTCYRYFTNNNEEKYEEMIEM